MRGGDQRSAGGEHRVDEEALAAGQVLGQTVRVRHLLGGVLLVALHAQEADFSSRNQAGHAVEHAQASAQHRHDDRARGGELLAGHRGDRRLDRRGHHGQVAGGLVGLKHHEFGDELAEGGGGGVLVAQHGELVLDQRMIQNMEFHDSQPSPSLPTCRIGNGAACLSDWICG